MSLAVRKKIATNPGNFKIAPWHFDARHRYRGNSGEWKLRRMDTCKEFERKSFPFAPPSANVAKFIEEEGMHCVNRSDTLPPWVAVLACQQRSAGAIDRPGGVGEVATAAANAALPRAVRATGVIATPTLRSRGRMRGGDGGDETAGERLTVRVARGEATAVEVGHCDMMRWPGRDSPSAAAHGEAMAVEVGRCDHVRRPP